MGDRDGTVCLQSWEGEQNRAYSLHRARCVREDGTCRVQAPAAPVSAYLRQRVERKRPLPRVALQRGRATRASTKRGMGAAGGEVSEEEKDAMIDYVTHDLAPELYIELMQGFYR